MTYTLFDATLGLARLLGNVYESTTTSAGTSQSAIDSTFTQADDYWNGGTIWFKNGSFAGKYRVITDFIASADTFFFSALSGSTMPGTGIAVMRGDWPVDKLVAFINQGIADIGLLPQVNESLTTTANQERYTLPGGVYNVKKVAISVPSSSPVVYAPHWDWEELSGKLCFAPGTFPQDDGCTIRINYIARPAILSADSDTINDLIHPERLLWAAAVHAWRWRMQMSRGDEPTYKAHFDEALAQAAAARIRYPIRGTDRSPRLSL
jgi:hypothetical protein